MKFNRGGLICVGIWACYVLLTLAAAYLVDDGKNRWFFVMLSSLPGGFFVGNLPDSMIEWLFLNYSIAAEIGMYLLSFAIAYLSGWAIEKIILGISPWLNRLDDRWFDRVHRDDR